jgi:hypothetical protein
MRDRALGRRGDRLVPGDPRPTGIVVQVAGVELVLRGRSAPQQRRMFGDYLDEGADPVVGRDSVDRLGADSASQ